MGTRNASVSKQVLVLEMSEDTEGSENDHFSKGTLLASRAQGGGRKNGVEGRQCGFLPSRRPPFSLEQNEARVFSAAL